MGAPIPEDAEGTDKKEVSAANTDDKDKEETGEPILAATLLELVEKGGHSGIVGYAFDGYPVYGPVGWGPDKKSKVMRSSYQKQPGQVEAWRGSGALYTFVEVSLVTVSILD